MAPKDSDGERAESISISDSDLQWAFKRSSFIAFPGSQSQSLDFVQIVVPSSIEQANITFRLSRIEFRCVEGQRSFVRRRLCRLIVVSESIMSLVRRRIRVQLRKCLASRFQQRFLCFFELKNQFLDRGLLLFDALFLLLSLVPSFPCLFVLTQLLLVVLYRVEVRIAFEVARIIILVS